MSNNNQIMDWYYKHDADITYGEVHVSKVPKVLLILLSILIISLGVVGYIYKDYIYDFMTDPKLELVKEVKHSDGLYTKVEVNDPNYNPLNYVNNNITEDIKFTFEIEDCVDVNTLGDYHVYYRSANNVYSCDYDLLVQVVDTTIPVINLKDSKFDPNLEFNEDTNTMKLSLIYEYEDKFKSEQLLKDTFDPSIYIDSLYDNYSSEDYLYSTLFYTENFDFHIPDDKYSISFNVIYQINDEQGNIGTSVLEVTVFENIEARKAQELDKQAQIDKLEKELYDLLHPSVTPTPTLSPTPTPTPSPIATPTPRVTATPTPYPTPTGEILNTETPTPEITEEIKATVTPTPTVTLQAPVVTVDPNEPENTGTPTPTPVLEVGDAGIWAGDVTVSLKDVGNDPTGMFLFNECIKQVHYVNTEVIGATPINMPGVDVQLKAGKYIVTWTTMDGKLTCEQRVTITE